MMQNELKLREGQKAWHIRFGWGIICDKPTIYGLLKFRNGKGEVDIHRDGRLNADDLCPIVFHKMQELDYSESPPPIGSWGYAWDGMDSRVLFYGELLEINHDTLNRGNSFPFKVSSHWFKYFSLDMPPYIEKFKAKKK